MPNYAYNTDSTRPPKLGVPSYTRSIPLIASRQQGSTERPKTTWFPDRRAARADWIILFCHAGHVMRSELVTVRKSHRHLLGRGSSA